MFTYNDLIDRMDGFTVGNLVISEGIVALQTQDDEIIPLATDAHIEVLNDGTYLRVSCVDALAWRDPNTGWHTLAGVYARVK